MKVILTEAVKPISKLERNINSKIIPSMQQMGYNFDMARTLKEKFVNTYFGSYKDRLGLSTPFTFVLNSASPKLTDHRQLTGTLSLGGETKELGSFNANEGRTVQDAIDRAFPDPTSITKKYNKKITGNENPVIQKNINKSTTI